MTREEAIKILEEEAEFLYGGDEPYNKIAFDMAIESLTYQNLSKPNNTCEVDLISRKDAMGAVQDHFSADGFKGYYDGQKMMDRITALPSAKAKDIIAPKIKAECRIDEHGVLWVETKQWEKVNRVIVREKDSIFCKMFEIPIEEVEPLTKANLMAIEALSERSAPRFFMQYLQVKLKH